MQTQGLRAPVLELKPMIPIYRLRLKSLIAVSRLDLHPLKLRALIAVYRLDILPFKLRALIAVSPLDIHPFKLLALIAVSRLDIHPSIHHYTHYYYTSLVHSRQLQLLLHGYH